MSSDQIVLSTSPELPPAEPIDLDDVLDVSFLDSDTSDHGISNVSTEPESRKHLKNLSRWDVISVGTFRQTLETAGSEVIQPSDGFSYENMLKKNPLGTMLYDNKAANPPCQSRGRSSTNVVVSPVILPVRDGDRTPTNVPLTQSRQHSPHHQHPPHKSRKEPRKEKKKKPKGSAPVPHKHQHYQHRHHQHHPNMKSRSSSSMQRTNFFSSPASSVPPLNL
jgi:hypothetical protein